MAEVFGLVASGVSISALVGQIASSVVKLKSYLDQIKDAPKDISSLIEEIEDVQFLLSDIEDDQSRHPYSPLLFDNSSASRCLDRCKRRVERLRRVVDEIAVDFENLPPMKRSLKAAKIIWKRDRVEKFRADLSGAVRLMTLSHQIYTRSLIQLQPEIITGRITQLLQTESAQRVPTSSTLSSSTDMVQGSCSSMEMDSTVKQYRPTQIQPAWLRWKSWSSLIGRAWDMEICRSRQGWDFSLRVYAYVSSDSLVVKYTYGGDVEGLRRLFSQGLASPFTVCLDTTYGFNEMKTLLDIGATEGTPELCKLLISEGADPEYSTYDEIIQTSTGFISVNVTPMDALVGNGMLPRSCCSDPSDSSSSVLHNFSQLAGILGARSEVTLQTLSFYCGPASAFSVLVKQMETPIGEWPIMDRRSLAIRLAENVPFNGPDLFLMALGCNAISRATIADEDILCDQFTLLHAAAGAIGRLSLDPGWLNFEEFKHRSILGWKSIIHDLLAAGADLHAECAEDYLHVWLPEGVETDDQITPLMLMFVAAFHEAELHDGCVWDLDNTMNIWISTLYDYGVDLKEYGLQESLTWVNLEGSILDGIMYTEYTATGTRPYDSIYYRGRTRLLGFKYGPLPEDWKLRYNEPTDEFAGDFWLMVEGKVEVMPGTWIE